MRELLARVRVLFRRTALESAPKEAPLRAGDLELDLQRYTVKWKGQAVNLTVTEFMMLHALVRHPGHVKSRKQLHQEGYPHDAYVSERTIDSHIKRLRRKFEEFDAAFDCIGPCTESDTGIASHEAHRHPPPRVQPPPRLSSRRRRPLPRRVRGAARVGGGALHRRAGEDRRQDRKSTRLNSSHLALSR